MKKVNFWEVEPDIRRFMQTCPRGQYKYCSLWGVDHWQDGRIFYYVLAKPQDDWIEVIQPMSHWSDTPDTLGLPIDEEELEGQQQWPWA